MRGIVALLLLWAQICVGGEPACQPLWSPDFYHVTPGVGGSVVYTITEFQEAMYFGGIFSSAGPLSATNNVVGWNGDWFALGSGLNGAVHSVAVFDDGTGPALYAGGNFTASGSVSVAHIARWNGTQWTALGPGLDGEVFTLYVFNNGTGNALYAGGEFNQAGSLNAPRVARWNGQSWQAVGTTLRGSIFALGSYNNGAQNILLAAGAFQVTSSIKNIAQFVGNSWQALGTGLNNQAQSLAIFDDGNGPAIYVGGSFSQAGGINALSIAKWQNGTWSAVGSGFNGWCRALAVFDDGSGPHLYAGGDFSMSGNSPVLRVARWTGTNWVPLDAGVTDNVAGGYVYSLKATSMPFDGGPKLYVGGSFGVVNNGDASKIATWDGANWRLLHRGQGMNNNVDRLIEADLGTGAELYAVGIFNNAGNVPSRGIARWDGATWHSLGRGIDSGSILDAAAFDDGTGPALYIAGTFPTINNQPVNYVAKWDGQSWSSLEGGMNNYVRALAVYDDGNGPALYAGGLFTIAGNVPANRIARWDGQHWTRLGGLGNGVSGGEVRDLAVFSGNGPTSLYVGGAFTAAGGNPAIQRLAAWDGAQWNPVGDGSVAFVDAFDVLNDPVGPALYVRSEWSDYAMRRWDGSAFTMSTSVNPGGTVETVIVHDDGSGPSVFAGGSFITIGDPNKGWITGNGVAKWNGATWASLGTGLHQCGGSTCFPTAFAFAVADDGSPDGPSLYVGGAFLQAGNILTNRIAKWNGVAWSGLGPGISVGAVFALRQFQGQGPAALYAAGAFYSSNLSEPAQFGRWEICQAEQPPAEFDLISPTAGELIDNLSPPLKWSQALGLFVRYDVSVAFDPGMTQVVFDAVDLLGLDATLPPNTLTFGHDYYWQVRAHNPVGELIKAQSFRTIGDPDINQSGSVNSADLLELINQWGPCGARSCPADLDGDGVVNCNDLLILIQHWSSS